MNTPRGRFLLLSLVGLAWAVLGVVNLVRSQRAIGVFYLVIGLSLVAAGVATYRAMTKTRGRG